MVRIFFTNSDGTKVEVDDPSKVPDDREYTIERVPEIRHEYIDRVYPDSNGGTLSGDSSEYVKPIRSLPNNYYSFYTYGEETEQRQDYGPIEDRGEQITVSHPVDDTTELDRTAHIDATLHSENKDKFDTSIPNDGTAFFSYAIIDHTDAVFEEEGLNPAQLDVSKPMLMTLLLYIAKGFRQKDGGVGDFIEYLKKEEFPVAKALGVSETVEEGNLSYHIIIAENKLEDIHIEQIKGAAKRAVFSAYRNGVVLPEEAMKKYNLDRVDPIDSDRLNQDGNVIDRSKIDPKYKQDELREWVKRLVDKTLDPLTFGRQNPSWSILDLLGLFATSALVGEGTGAARKYSAWDFDQDHLPSYNLAYRNILYKVRTEDGIDSFGEKEETATEIPSIEEQFNQVHRNLLDLAEEYNFFEPPHTLAVDGIKFETERTDIEDTIERPPPCNSDNTEEWFFMVASFVNSPFRYTLGAKLITTKEDKCEAAEALLEYANENFENIRIRADKGMAQADFVNLFRKVADHRWIIRAPRGEKQKDVQRLTPLDRAGYVENFQWGLDLEDYPNLIAVPYSSSFKQVKAEEEEEEEEEEEDKKDKRELKTPIQFDYEIFKKDDPWENNATPNIDLPRVSGKNKLTKQQDENSNILKYPGKFRDLQSLNVEESIGTHALYYTDRTMPKMPADWIHTKYDNRWGIEATMDQIRNTFMPPTGSKFPEHRLYHLHLAILFENWYTMINRAISPNLAIRLNPTPQEFLRAIQDVAVGQHTEDSETD